MTQTDRERRREPFRRGLGSPALFAIVYTSVASAVYFSLGVIADHALGLTPLVFLAAGVFFAAGRDDLHRGLDRCIRTAPARPCSRASRSTSS